MRYALNLSEDWRVLSATFEQYAADGAVLVDTLPDGDISEYLYVDGEFVHDPLPKTEEKPTETEQLRADVDYLLMLQEG